jgi:hypothetical protein
MFYEARTHEALDVSDAQQAAKMIKAGTIYNYHILRFPCEGKTLLIVPDGSPHASDAHEEVAVLLQEADGLFQIESITAAWVKTDHELAQYFIGAVKEPCGRRKTDVIIGKPQGHETAQFECGCCGTVFTGVVQEQLAFDQDAGFGICNKCNQWY